MIHSHAGVLSLSVRQKEHCYIHKGCQIIWYPYRWYITSSIHMIPAVILFEERNFIILWRESKYLIVSLLTEPVSIMLRA
jgi:hypothetical protein